MYIVLHIFCRALFVSNLNRESKLSHIFIFTSPPFPLASTPTSLNPGRGATPGAGDDQDADAPQEGRTRRRRTDRCIKGDGRNAVQQGRGFGTARIRGAYLPLKYHPYFSASK
jgi:hypothetical protein